MLSQICCTGDTNGKTSTYSYEYVRAVWFIRDVLIRGRKSSTAGRVEVTHRLGFDVGEEKMKGL